MKTENPHLWTVTCPGLNFFFFIAGTNSATHLHDAKLSHLSAAAQTAAS